MARVRPREDVRHLSESRANVATIGSFTFSAILRASLLVVLGASSAAATVGCTARPTRPPASAPTVESLRGVTSARFVVDPANPAKGLPKGTELQPPTPLAVLPLPAYPAEPLAAAAGAATVGVRFVVGKEGDVTETGASPIVPSTEGPYADAFRAAAEATVRTWKFEPAWIVTSVDGRDVDGDGKSDYRKATSLEIVPVYLDVRIEFSIVDGKAKVHVSGLPGRE